MIIMNYEEKGLKEWKVIILIRMYKDSNFFFRLLASFVSLYSFSHPLILSLSFSPSLLSLSLIRSLLLPHTHTRTQSSFFLSFTSTHFYHSASNKYFIIPSPSPFFIHASISFIYTIAWPGTGSRSEGTSIVKITAASSLRNLYQWRNKIGLE